MRILHTPHQDVLQDWTLFNFVTLYLFVMCRKIVALLLNNLKETKLKIYKSVFVGAVVSSKLFQHRGEYWRGWRGGQEGDGVGVRGQEGDGVGVRGQEGDGVGVRGQEGDGVGVRGQEGDGVGVRGQEGDGVGVRGQEGDGMGVRGQEGDGMGVRGQEGDGMGGRGQEGRNLECGWDGGGDC